jgi:hypothetical protein
LAAGVEPREDFFVGADYTAEGGYLNFKKLIALESPNRLLPLF